MKLNKTFLIWLVLVTLWNFGFPRALPICDVAVAVVLSFLVKKQEDKTQ
jgi:hypothetical protein